MMRSAVSTHSFLRRRIGIGMDLPAEGAQRGKVGVFVRLEAGGEVDLVALRQLPQKLEHIPAAGVIRLLHRQEKGNEEDLHSIDVM